MKKQIYIVTRLFNVHDRIAALELYERICMHIKKGELIGIDTCYLPYRDSNEKVKDKEEKTYEIFKMDCESIKNSLALVGYLDGPTYDSGIGFEIGYSFVLGKKIVIMNSDYFCSERDRGEKYSVCALLQSIAKTIHVKECKEKTDYKSSLLALREELWEKLVSELNEINDKSDRRINESENGYKYYIDPAFNYNEPGREILKKIELLLKTEGITYYIGNSKDYINGNDLLNRLQQCEKIVVYSEGFELGIESAIMQGMAYAMNKRIYLYATDNLRLFQNEEFILFKNPMIEHSADKILSSYKELTC
ncbi:MAG: nucleoside 2-deoxyribosyltransferase [Lachnoclostridium sp.]|nr:nucleoside 2-deoxyribosyltransferase [Lachnospira sp.]MCM1248916.1 nucleoside 2-deoxyribosyltransferase [Lachnoclostridium sp.]MCM1535228.1 nucleoside 2-deoxyribosyltransferase [Clostridium sp.]